MFKIAIVGIGGVGKAFLKLLGNKKTALKNQGFIFTVNYIMNSKIGVFSENGIDIKQFLDLYEQKSDLRRYYDSISYDELLKRRDIDFLVEMTPTNKETAEPGLTYIKKALTSGINVVTSNKGPVLLSYKRLKQLAKENGVQLGIGCTTGGALPAINGGIMDLAGSDILSIEGVLNGTTNFIINEMEREGITYDKALLRAQKSGIAETNPYLDVEGWDTAIKLVILTNVLMNEDISLEDASVKGIIDITPEEIEKASAEGKKYKLIGKTERLKDTLKINVGLEKIGIDNPFYFVDGKNKAVKYESDTLGELIMMGGHSDTTAAAASVLRDIINISKGCKFF